MEFGIYTDVYLDSIKSTTTKKPAPVRKKFAVPPVKVACLECRASRTRCDGKTECSNCTNKGKACVYTQSKRGGSRIRKKKIPPEFTPPSNNSDLNHCALSVLPELDQASFTGPLSFVAPGGGLKQLDLAGDDTEFVFDSIFPSPEIPLDSGYETSSHPGASPDVDHGNLSIRVYSSDEDILSAYYVYIHPYFPVLPPPAPHQVTDNPDSGTRQSPDAIFTSHRAPDFEPSSAISLAISASLALIPHPNDLNSFDPESVLLRRVQAQAFAQSAFESIEIESELLESSNQPGEALSVEPSPPARKPFHPEVPIEIESIIALLLLSTYEYAQRGNVAKMRNRAGQAFHAAIDMGLHSKGNEEGFYAEANRRTWWMSYIAACQGAILSNSAPPMQLYDPRFTTARPTFAADPDSWHVFVQSQQMITTSTQFVIDLDASLKTNANASSMWDRMLELDNMIEPLIMNADSWASSLLPPTSLDRSELCVAQALRGMARIKLNSARIKLHRYCAFSDFPVFPKKHCDLKSTNVQSTSNSTTTSTSPNCGCSATFQQLPTPPRSFSLSPTSSTPNLVAPSAIAVGGGGAGSGDLPFSSHFSSRVCFKAAFNIAHSFRNLPFPQPVRADDVMSFFPLSMQVPQDIGSGRASPRMIPIFACCAMQSSYAMIMLSYKTKAMGFLGGKNGSNCAIGNGSVNGVGNGHGRGSMNGGMGDAQGKMMAQLHEGLLTILGALRNYSIAYEAMGGMRDQIEIATNAVHMMQSVTLLES